MSGAGKKCRPYGSVGAYSGRLRGIILGFHGHSNSFVSGIGAYYLRFAVKGERFGGYRGSPWDDTIQTHIPHIVNIVICHEASVDSIQVDYELL